MTKSLRSVTLMALVLFSSLHLTGQAEEKPAIQDLYSRLTFEEHDRLVTIILIKDGIERFESMHDVYQALLSKPENEAYDLIMLAKNKDFLAPADVVFEVDTIDFGKVSVGSILRDTFHFNVREGASYVIKGYRSSCPYLTLERPEFPTPPGESGKMPITLNTRRMVEGPVRMLFVVEGNNGRNYRKVLYVKADLTNPIDYGSKRP